MHVPRALCKAGPLPQMGAFEPKIVERVHRSETPPGAVGIPDPTPDDTEGLRHRAEDQLEADRAASVGRGPVLLFGEILDLRAQALRQPGHISDKLPPAVAVRI